MRTVLMAVVCSAAAMLAPSGARADACLGAAAARATAAAPSGCGERALREAAEADLRLRETHSCAPAEIEKLAAAIRALEACGGAAERPAQWVFPLAGQNPAKSIGGKRGSSYKPARRIPCYAAEYVGHPAHDLFVRDPEHVCVDGQGQSFVVRAVEAGRVLIARDGWAPGNALKGGNYVLLYLPTRRQLAYYAHLGEVSVRAGQKVGAGDRLGTLGRTGLNAWQRRSPTHLHFGLWDAKTFKPVDSYLLLRSARREP